MKKIAILLALALALSCCLLMLASCGASEESSEPAASTGNSSAGTSTDTSSTSSSAEETTEPESTEPESSEPESTEPETSEPETTEPETSEPETSEPETSEPETSEPATSEPETSEPETSGGNDNPDNANRALGKSYTKSQLFQQGESVDAEGNKTWGWSDSVAPSYPDEGNVTLTDGKFAANDSTYSGEEWMGFHSGCPDYTTNGYSYFTVDLGDSYDLSKLVVYVGTSKLTGGISVPATVEFLVSEDGSTFTSVGSVAPADDPNNSVLAVEQTCSVTARYVQVRMTAANWMFVCEFEAY